jgi:hypothetical protein
MISLLKAELPAHFGEKKMKKNIKAKMPGEKYITFRPKFRRAAVPFLKNREI